MALTTDLIFDAYTGLSHKDIMSDAGVAGASPIPSWVGTSNRRRLLAYMVLWAYRKNAARFLLRPDPKNPDAMLQHREYGDPELLVQTIRAAVLGGDPRALVDGADDEPGKPPSPEDVQEDEGLDPATAQAEIDRLVAEALAEWEQKRAETDAATARQDWLDGWWRDERADQKVIEAENTAVGLGDGVFELVNSTRKGRTRLRVHEPGFYFPVHADDAQGDDFPDRVHLAWPFEDDAGNRFVRRITYELVTLADLGMSARTYDYAPGVTSEWTCLKTDATWNVNDLGDVSKGVDALSPARAVYAVNEEGVEINQLDLDQDYIPVVHVPNTPAIVELWGESALTRVAQVLDDLAATDTDTAVAGALVAAPPIAMSGVAQSGAQTIETYGPGQVFRTGDGSMNVLDTSSSLDALLKWQTTLLDRLSVVRQVPQSILGRVDLSGQLAGITLLLSFGPFRQYVGDLRLVRQEKYGLLLKFVQRMSISGGWLEGEPMDANLAFGPFLPTDQSAVKDMVVALVAARLLSRATGMRMLQEAGIDIDSIEDEMDAVRRLDFSGAGELADAVADDQAARLYLGLPDAAGTRQGATGGGSQPPAPAQPPNPADQGQAPPADVPPTPLP